MRLERDDANGMKSAKSVVTYGSLEEGAGNAVAHRANHLVASGVPSLALQQRVGLLSKRRPRCRFNGLHHTTVIGLFPFLKSRRPRFKICWA